MADLSAVEAGEGTAVVAPEFIAIDDYLGLVELLSRSVTGLDETADLREELDAHYARYADLLKP